MRPLSALEIKLADDDNIHRTIDERHKYWKAAKKEKLDGEKIEQLHVYCIFIPPSYQWHFIIITHSRIISVRMRTLLDLFVY